MQQMFELCIFQKTHSFSNIILTVSSVYFYYRVVFNCSLYLKQLYGYHGFRSAIRAIHQEKNNY